METARFDYDLPAAAIAQAAIEPRDDARLLDARDLRDHRFRDLPGLLDPGDLVVVNRTRVRPGRLRGTKRDTGGAVEVLLVGHLGGERWRAMVRPARRLRPGTALRLGTLEAVVVAGPEEGVAVLEIPVPAAVVDEVLREQGEVPLPPYFTGDLGDPERYQTMFADTVGSAAAPTAGLHFTPAVVAALGEREIAFALVDLSVGLDTFRPITTAAVEDHRIHREEYAVPEKTAAAVAATRERGGRVVAVGTTTVRALESAAGEDGALAATAGETGLYITPGYRFRVVDLMVTNFHFPRSTLLVMLEAFMGPGWRQAYAAALERGYRFLSFGDAMLAARA